MFSSIPAGALRPGCPRHFGKDTNLHDSRLKTFSNYQAEKDIFSMVGQSTVAFFRRNLSVLKSILPEIDNGTQTKDEGRFDHCFYYSVLLSRVISHHPKCPEEPQA